MTDRPDIEPTASAVKTGLGKARLRRALDLGLWALVIGLFGWRFGPQLMAATGVGDTAVPAPAFELTTLDGQTLTSESMRGSVVLVNFWATWCAPCRLEMPAFERVYKARKDEGFVVVGLSTDVAGGAVVRQFIDERAITYPIAMAPSGLAQAMGSPRAIPTSFLIDRSGAIRYRITGFFAEPALRAAVGRLLDEDGPRLDEQTRVPSGDRDPERDEREQRVR